MRISWHAFAVSAYCSLMVTSGFTTIKLPVSLATPVAGAEAAATRQVQIGIQSLGFSAGAITLPAAPAIPSPGVQPSPALAASSDSELEGWATWVQANGYKARLLAPYASRLGLSQGDIVVRSTKTFTGALQHTIYVTDVLGRTQVIFTTLNKAENKGVMYLVGLDGVLEKTCVGQNGSFWELPADEAKRDVVNERALWRKVLAGIGNS